MTITIQHCASFHSLKKKKKTHYLWLSDSKTLKQFSVFNWKFGNLKELDKEIRNQASNQQNMMTLIIMNQGNQQEIKKKSFIFFIWWSIPPIMLKKKLLYFFICWSRPSIMS